MNFHPMQRIWERVEVGRSESDTTLFHDLMYAGEFVSKVVVAALVAAIGEDKDRSRHRLVSGLVRADGIGDWSRTLGEALIGPASQHLLPEARIEQRELTQKLGLDSWQHEAVTQIRSCLSLVDPATEPMPTKVDGIQWARDFARLRNKTRGHGAPKTDILRKLCPALEQSLKLITENHSVFQREWVYLHRNLSGKYRVTKLSDSDEGFTRFKQATNINIENGVYINFGAPVRVDLAASDVDASNFYLTNGGFNDKRFEMLSYFSGDILYCDAAPFLGPTTILPGSETEGNKELDCIGNCLTNLPEHPKDYIKRPILENELLTIIKSDRYPVITLVGRGGTGKTTMTLSVLYTVAETTRFDLVLWFSARDLDLLSHGPKQVRPAVLTVKDVADEFVRLVAPDQVKGKGFNSLEFFAESLTKPSYGPTLFVFDNFETVINPSDFFKWVDTYVRHPNKIIITTRHHDFKGDYPIEVRGLEENEFDQLVNSVADKLNISHILTPLYCRELFAESEGHPYVVRILLGEVAKAGKLRKLERIVADADEILAALFERTYASLSPVAQRVFLTLCGWRSTIPKLAVEAVLLRPQNEKMAISDAIELLDRSSFVEIIQSEADQEYFISVPLVASMFGKRKLAVSPMKSAVEADMEILRQFGAGQRIDVRRGLAPRIERLVRSIADQIASDISVLENHIPMLEFLARHYPPMWLHVARLQEEGNGPEGKEHAKDAIRRHLETAQGRSAIESWKFLAMLCKQTGDTVGEIHALVELAENGEAEFAEISNVSNRFNSILVDRRYVLDSEEKRILVNRLANVMEQRLDEADATDCSRLAWLYLHLKNIAKAASIAKKGLQLDPENEYCQSLGEKLAYEVD